MSALQESRSGSGPLSSASPIGRDRIADGAVLTNAHNLRREQVTVTLADGRRVDGATPAPTRTGISRS